MFIYPALIWICCSAIVVISGQFEFNSDNVVLRNVVVYNSTGDVYIGGVNYIYRLNKDLKILAQVDTECIMFNKGICDAGTTVQPNTNLLLMFESLSGTSKLLACGTSAFGKCATFDLKSLSSTILQQTDYVIPTDTNYSSITLEDAANKAILIASTRTKATDDVIADYSAFAVDSQPGTFKVGGKLILSPPKKRQIHYILATIVGNYRYIFGYSTYGSSVARLCNNYLDIVRTKIQTYVEMPLSCVGKDRTKFDQLVTAQVVRPIGKIAKKFGINEDDDAVFVGVFQKASQSAVCTYTFKEINDYFWKNIEKCYSSNGVVVLNKYANTKCTKEKSTNCTSVNSKNKEMIGTITFEKQALVTCTSCGSVSSMDTTIYKDNIIAFVATKTGELNKFVISSKLPARKYETSSKIPGSSILSVNFDPNGASAYLLSQNKVLKIPAEECGNRTSCDSCVKNSDPYCGWCTLTAQCTTDDECPYVGSHLGYVRQSNQCISITKVSPPSLPLSESTVQKVNVSIMNLPTRPVDNAYWCSVNEIRSSSTLNDNTMECSVPTSAQLPEPSSETGILKAEIAVHSSETNATITTAFLELYKCSAITSCLKCTTGSLKCSWCHYKAECSADTSTNCPKSFAPWVSVPSNHQCPQLDSQTLYIPASVERAITIFGTQFPKPESPDGEYQCTVSADSQSFPTGATWNNVTSITCSLQQYKYSGSSVEMSANIDIKLGKSDIKPKSDADQVQVYLYRCQKAATQCGSCVGLAKTVYKCGWCVNTSHCSVHDGCLSGLWVKPAGECPGSPHIDSFQPKTGHVRGNTKLEIVGTEFGRKFSDVEKVSIAGLPCKTIMGDYIIAKRIVCLTNSSSKSVSARIKVVVAGKTGYSKDVFRYQSPQVDDYEPKIGPKSGGTKVRIYGKELDTGNDIRVRLGRSSCLNLIVTKTNMTCITSQFKNTTRRRRSISNDEKLVVTFNGLPPVTTGNFSAFQYVPDPDVTDITPRYIFPSSDRPINVTGSNLNSVYFPKIRLTFNGKFIEASCYKPDFANMLCPLPTLNEDITENLITAISLYLDGVTTWQNLENHPSFNTLTIVPDPKIYAFPDTHTLKVTTLEIKGKYLIVEGVEDISNLYVITVGGQRCNISSVAPEKIFCNAPDRKFLAKLNLYNVWVNVSGSSLKFNVGKLKYDIAVDDSPSTDMELIYIIVGVGCGVFLIIVILMCCFYRRKKRQQEQKERTYEMQMNSLESKVAKECREAFAELQTDMTDFTSDLGDAGIHFFDFKNYAMRVLFPGVDHHSVMDEKRAQESPKWDEALRTFSQLIGNKNFLLIFVKTLESQSQFKMQDRCNVASLLVIALQSKMDYCTDILQHLLGELIRKSISKSHPKLSLRRTECIAEKLLTNWLTFTMSNFIKDKAGKPLFMLYKAIRFQVEKGPVDVITNEARYSLSEDKLLRQSIEYNRLTVTVEFEDTPPVQLEVLDTDTIEQAKEKIMEVLFKNVPFSSRIPKDELTLKWVESPSNHTILKDEDATSVREGEWKRLNTLGHYQVPDRTCLRLVRRFVSPFDTSAELNRSLPKVSYSPSVHSTISLVQSSKQNINDADRKPWHLTKHVDSYSQDKDDPRHSKLLSEIYLTRLLSTKGTLQQYVDDMLDCIFPTFRKNERPPLPIKFLFDFLDDQARELNITDPEVLHTWKNNSLPLRFWVNLIKNPNFLFDVHKAPIVDSCLSVVAQLFMDACSVSEHVLGKDSPSNKLLYAKEIPAYRQKVESFYKSIAAAPRLTEEEVKDFFAAHYIEDFNVDSALKELYKYAAKYQDELQEALEDARYPQLASKLEHVVAIFTDD